MLKFVKGQRPLIAILGCFANLQKLEDPPADLSTNVFRAMTTTDDEGIRHRALITLCDYMEEQQIDEPNHKVQSELYRVQSTCSSNQVKVMARNLLSEFSDR